MVLELSKNLAKGAIILLACFQAYGLGPASGIVATRDKDERSASTTRIGPNATNETRVSRSGNPRTDRDDRASCPSNSMDEFPEDLFTAEERRHGAVVVHVLFGFYCFLVTAYACNDYLLPALDLICTDLNVSPNVAGATFLATASCFPELFVSLVGTFLTESDLGVGAVVGGAVFDTFATPAFGALSAAQGIQLEWTILSRDCVIYVVSVVVLVAVMWDGFVTWYEAALLIVMFAAYFTLLFLNDCRLGCSDKIRAKFCRESRLSREQGDRRSEHEGMPSGSFKPFVHGELVAEYRNSAMRATGGPKSAQNGDARAADTADRGLGEYVEPDFPWRLPSGPIWRKSWFLLVCPIKILLFATIPDCRCKKWRSWYLLTFVMCVMWIAVSSYLVSWMTTIVGDTLGIPDSIMGLTFLAAGGNMPELVSIVILSRQGNGDMAMSNTLGANTLDVLLCLGLPWTIKTLMTGKNIAIESGAMAYSVMSIVVCVIGFFLVTACYGFKLNRSVGILCLIMYALFLTVSILMELGLIFDLDFRACDS